MFDEQESGEFRLPAELARLEKRLAALPAEPLRIDRDRLMFAAGRAAGSRVEERGSRSEFLRARFWPVAAMAMTAATVILAAMLVWPAAWRGTGATPQVEVVANAADSAEGRPAADGIKHQFARYPVGWLPGDLSSTGYLGMRYVALTRGVDAIDRDCLEAQSATDEPMPAANSRELLKELSAKRTHASI
jgi:hypothetical protein